MSIYTFPVRHPRYLEHVVSIIFRQIIKHFVRCMDKSSSKFYNVGSFLEVNALIFCLTECTCPLNTLRMRLVKGIYWLSALQNCNHSVEFVQNIDVHMYT